MMHSSCLMPKDDSRNPENHYNCTSQQKVDTFFIFYTLKTEHSTPYIVLVSNSLMSMSMQVFLH